MSGLRVFCFMHGSSACGGILKWTIFSSTVPTAERVTSQISLESGAERRGRIARASSMKLFGINFVIEDTHRQGPVSPSGLCDVTVPGLTVT